MKAGAAPRTGRREWIGLAVLALPTLLIGLDVTALHLAIPSLSEDLAAVLLRRVPAHSHGDSASEPGREEKRSQGVDRPEPLAEGGG